MDLKREIIKELKYNGLSARSDAVKALNRVLNDEPESQIHESLKSIIREIKRSNLVQSGVVDVKVIEEVVKTLTKDDSDLKAEGLVEYDAFHHPKLLYNSLRKVFYNEPEKDHPPALFSDGQRKITMYRERFLLVMQRLMRNKKFTPPVLGSHKKDYIKITPVESLLGDCGIKFVLGMLVQLDEGKYYLEDLGGSVALDLSSVKNILPGFYTETCFVICQGEFIDNKFLVDLIGFPPPENKSDSLKVIKTCEYLGLNAISNEYANLKVMEEEDNSMFVILSNVHLDRSDVLEKLNELFQGFSYEPPYLFVIIGNFMSRPYGQNVEDKHELINNFDALASIIDKYPSIAENSRFVFVPGPTDPGSGNIVPRPPLPQIFTKSLSESIKNVTFASNPYRFRFFTQEIVIFREDLVHKMQRNSIPSCRNNQENNELDLSELVVRTVLDQSHLCPLPLAARPIYWEYNHALTLYPIPDVLLLADSHEQYLRSYFDCVASNPGSFSEDFSFVVYRPQEKNIELSKIE